MVKKILVLAFLGIITFTVSAQDSQAACPGPEFLGSPYEEGETIRLRGVSSVNPWFLCLYDPKGNLANYTVSQSNPTPSTISYTADAEGIWTGVVMNGSEFVGGLISTSCPESLEGRTIACSVTTSVTASTTTPPTTPTMPTEPTPPTAEVTYRCINRGTVESSETPNKYYYCDKECNIETIDDFCSESPCTTDYTCSTAEEACACSEFEEDPATPTTPTTPTTPAAPTTPATGTSASPATGGSYVNPLPGIHTLTEAATVMIQAILGLIGTIALLFLIIAGIIYITAAGEEEKIKKAKGIITGTIVGLGIALLAFSFLQVIVEILN